MDGKVAQAVPRLPGVDASGSGHAELQAAPAVPDGEAIPQSLPQAG